MNRARAGRMIVALMVACVLGLSGCAPGRRPQSAARRKVASVNVVGTRAKSFQVRLSDGRALSVPDGKQYVALWLGDPSQAAQAAGGLAQLVPLLPQVRCVVVPAKLEERPRPGAPKAAASSLPVGTPQVGVAESRSASTVAAALGRLLGGERRWSAEWWLIDPAGKVVVYGKPGEATPIMEAELVWPFVGRDMATPAPFQPTPIARLSPDGASRKWPERMAALWRSRLVEPYRQYGQRDKAWDEPALAFLEQRSLALAQHDSAPSATSLAAQADGLMAKRCTDPLVICQCALALAENREFSASGRLCAKVPPAARGSKYPPRVLYGLLAEATSSDGGKGVPPEADIHDPLAQSLTKPFAPGEQRIDLAQMRGTDLFSEANAPQTSPASAAALARPGADLWVRACMDARMLADQAFAARGGDIAARTTAAQFASLARGLEASTKSAALAWKLHPDYPEAAAHMVWVCQGQDDANGCRLWTERALSADIGSPVSWRLYSTLWPRWGGTHEAMRAFGREMSDDALFDTNAPLAAWWAQQSIQDDDKESGALTDKEAVDRMVTVLGRMAEVAKTAERRDRLRTYRLAVLVRAGRPAEAAANELGDQVDMSVFGGPDEELADALQVWLADRYLGSGGLDAAAKARKEGRLDEARESYQRGLAKQPVAVVRRWLISAIARVDALAKDRAGTPTPSADLPAGTKAMVLDSELNGWRPLWKDEVVVVDPPGTATFAGSGSAALDYLTALPANVEVSLEVNVGGTAKQQVRVELNDGSRQSPATLDIGPDFASAGGMGSGAGYAKLEPREWRTVRLRAMGGEALAFVDGWQAKLNGSWPEAKQWKFSVRASRKPDGPAPKVRSLSWRSLQ